MQFLDDVKNWILNQGAALGTKVLQAVILLVVGLLIMKLIMRAITAVLEKSKLEKAAHGLIKTLAQTVMWVLLGLIVASALGIDVTGVVALASVVTLVVSLSLQNMLSNVVGGFTLLYTHPFGAGDYVEVAGQSGTVKEVGMTYTKLTTPDNKVVFIPNSAVVSAEIVNYTVTGTRRISIPVSASYDAPAEQVIASLVATAQLPTVLQEPEKAYAVLVGYGDSAVNYELRFWVKGEDYWSTYFAIMTQIKLDFDAKGIQMTYPHLNVHIEK